MSITTLPEVTPKVAGELGLNEPEFRRIIELLGRKPNFTELSVFSVMWSEHCCYKNSLRWLKTLPKGGPQILAEAGEENAGLVDIGHGLACAFKIESHNHPSAIEPYQGAATGVGGIHRDIFTMGARPLAALNALRFGELDSPKTKRLLKGVVKGIGDYGNSFGVPTVGGELYFDKSYQTNPLVNAMSAGILPKGKTLSAIAKGAGNPVYIVGSATGKDGIHGATFASEDIGDDAESKLPAVQVGDPFQEKLLLEATLAAAETGGVVGMQDMGAAGIACSTSEMAFKGAHGMVIHLDRVPTRQAGMQPFELLLSESQERMLVVVEKGREADIEAVFDKWDLNCTLIGEVTKEERLKYYMHGEPVADIAPRNLALGGDTPVYEREVKAPAYLDKIRAFDMDQVPVPDNLQAVAKFLAGHPNIASKRWVTEQYDSMVQTNNMSTNRPSDAAVIRLKQTAEGKPSRAALALTTDCNAHYVYASPRKGAMIAVAEAARNIVCAGGEPLAVTNCLNFGNPLKPEVYWQFAEAVTGMGEACRQLGTPVTGGNVSFYNQSGDGGAVLPTPVIGMVGLLKDAQQHMTLAFQDAGDAIYLLGQPRNDISSSQYLLHYHKQRHSPAPHFDMKEEKQLHGALRALIKKSLIRSAHDLSEGGLFITLLESAMAGQQGFTLTLPENIRPDAYLFGEAQSRAVVSVAPEDAEAFEATVAKSGTPFQKTGATTEKAVEVDGASWGDVQEWMEVYEGALERKLGD